MKSTRPVEWSNKMKSTKFSVRLVLAASMIAAMAVCTAAEAQVKKPKSSYIWGDDIGESRHQRL